MPLLWATIGGIGLIVAGLTNPLDTTSAESGCPAFWVRAGRKQYSDALYDSRHKEVLDGYDQALTTRHGIASIAGFSHVNYRCRSFSGPHQYLSLLSPVGAYAANGTWWIFLCDDLEAIAKETGGIGQMRYDTWCKVY